MTRNFVREMEMALNGQQPILDQMQQQLKEQKENMKKQHRVAHNVGETGMIMDGVSNSPIKGDDDKLHKLETEIKNLNDLKYIEKVARSQYKLIKPNEVPIVIRE